MEDCQAGSTTLEILQVGIRIAETKQTSGASLDEYKSKGFSGANDLTGDLLSRIWTHFPLFSQHGLLCFI